MRADFMKNYETLFYQTGSKECGNCGEADNLYLHHIVPLVNGGTNRTGNLQALCKGCPAKSQKKQMQHTSNR